MFLPASEGPTEVSTAARVMGVTRSLCPQQGDGFIGGCRSLRSHGDSIKEAPGRKIINMTPDQGSPGMPTIKPHTEGRQQKREVGARRR